MKRYMLIAAGLLFFASSRAQLTSGTFIFTRTLKLKLDMQGGGHAPRMPEQMQEDFELLMDQNRTLWRPAPSPENMGEEGPVVIHVMGPGQDETYSDFSKRTTITRHEVGNEFYILPDSFSSQVWKLTNETKTILGHSCRKALTERIITTTRMDNENGKMTIKEGKDTVHVEAWYAEDILLAAGPEYQGTLPGMILELSVDEGRIHFLATGYRKGFEKKALVKPEGTVITREELESKRRQMFGH